MVYRDTLAAELAAMVGDSDITTLMHVRSAEDIRAEAEMTASRENYRDFDQFKALFDGVKKDLEAGLPN